MLLYGIILSTYYLFILWLIIHWSKLEVYIPSKQLHALNISVLIPFRNEKENILACIQSVIEQNYPSHLFEIIAINDHSNDNSLEIVKEMATNNSSIKILNLKDKFGKKEGIKAGITQVSGNWIITLDADCVVKPNWLNTLASFVQDNDKEYIVMPVIFQGEKTVFEKLQSLEFLSLIATSAACIQGNNPLMSNGANIAFTKEKFEEVNGFEGNEHISSGDDLFLMQKIVKTNPEAIGYLHHKDVIVATSPTSNWKDFIQQRIRWGSKTKAYKSVFAKGVAILIVLSNLTIVLGAIFSFINDISGSDFIYFFLVKFLLDGFFLWKSTSFYGKEKLLIYVPFLAIVYPIYIFVVSTLSLFYVPKWKGRKI